MYGLTGGGGAGYENLRKPQIAQVVCSIRAWASQFVSQGTHFQQRLLHTGVGVTPEQLFRYFRQPFAPYGRGRHSTTTTAHTTPHFYHE